MFASHVDEGEGAGAKGEVLGLIGVNNEGGPLLVVESQDRIFDLITVLADGRETASIAISGGIAWSEIIGSDKK